MATITLDGLVGLDADDCIIRPRHRDGRIQLQLDCRIFDGASEEVTLVIEPGREADVLEDLEAVCRQLAAVCRPETAAAE